MNWRLIATAPKDGTMINLFCPGMSSPTGGVLQGQWNERLQNWVLNPFGTTSFTTLFPTYWDNVEAPPA